MKHIRYYGDPLAPDSVARVQDEWISPQAYTEMVEKTLIPCTDAILTVQGDDQAIYLARRVTYPMAGVWCLGGRIFFNDETLEQSIARCVRLETGMEIPPSRFEHIGVAHLYSWVKTAQGDFPGKNLAISFKLEVSADEREEMEKNLKSTEYDTEFGLQRFTRQRLLNEGVHPAMVDLFDDIYPKP